MSTGTASKPKQNHGPQAQSGVAALTVTMLLLFVSLLVVAFTNRHLLFEQRAAANQVRSTVAIEAAQAGLEWAQALLNSPKRLDAACNPNADASSRTFRDIQLSYDASTRMQVVTPGLTAACLRDGAQWHCHCPMKGPAMPSVPTGDTPLPGFVVKLSTGEQPGQVQLHSKGCSQSGPACWDMTTPTPSLTAHSNLQVTLALTGGLRTLPASALTARGAVHGTDLGVHHIESGASGIAIHAGSSIQMVNPRISTVAANSLSESLIANDPDLSNLATAEFFTAVWGLNSSLWMEQTSVVQLSCTADCGTTLQTELAHRGNRMVLILGDASFAGPLELGSAEHPVLLIATGTLSFSGAVKVHGALFAQDLNWTNSSGALLRGAAWSSADVHSTGALDIFHDPKVLARLRWNTGSWVRMPGSWRDF